MSETTNLKLFKHDNPSTNENQFDVTKALNNNWDKIDEFAETTNTKITENQNNIKSLQTDNTTNKQDIATLKSDNTTNKQDIANLKTENEELKAENERLNQDLNALPSNTAEGEYITLTDSADSRFNKFKIKGNSIQNGEPTPLNQIKIQNVEGNVNVTICNRNIANSNEVYSNMKAFNSQQCSEIIEDEKECIKFDNTSFRPDTLKHFNLINFKFKENTSYTIRGLFKKENQSPSIGLFIQVVYTDGTQDMVDSSANGWIELRLVSNASKTIRNIGFSYSNPRYYYLDKSSIFIGEGNANDYILNQQKKFVFPLEEGQVLREGDCLADDGIHHKRKQVLIDLEKFAMSMPFEGLCVISNRTIYLDYIGVQGLCNYFKNAENESIIENSSARNYLKDNEFNVRMGDTKDRFYFKNSAFTTLEQWQDFFNNNEVIVEYECNEYVEAYTDEQKQVYDEIVKTAKTYKTVTNIFSTNEVSPKFEIEYRQDIKSLINNVSQAVLNNA